MSNRDEDSVFTHVCASISYMTNEGGVGSDLCYAVPVGGVVDEFTRALLHEALDEFINLPAERQVSGFFGVGALDGQGDR